MSEAGYAAYDAAFDGGYGYEHASGGEAVDAQSAAQDFSGEHGGAAKDEAFGGFTSSSAAGVADMQDAVTRGVADARGAAAADADADPDRADSEAVWQYRGRALEAHDWQQSRAYDLDAIRRREAARGFVAGQRGAEPSDERTYPTGWLSAEFAESVALNEALLACDDIVRLGEVVAARLEEMKAAELGTVCLTTALHRVAVFWTDLQAEAEALVAARDPRDVTELVRKQRETVRCPCRRTCAPDLTMLAQAGRRLGPASVPCSRASRRLVAKHVFCLPGTDCQARIKHALINCPLSRSTSTLSWSACTSPRSSSSARRTTRRRTTSPSRSGRSRRCASTTHLPSTPSSCAPCPRSSAASSPWTWATSSGRAASRATAAAAPCCASSPTRACPWCAALPATLAV